jgi:hypothetical protein
LSEGCQGFCLAAVIDRPQLYATAPPLVHRLSRATAPASAPLAPSRILDILLWIFKKLNGGVASHRGRPQAIPDIPAQRGEEICLL